MSLYPVWLMPHRKFDLDIPRFGLMPRKVLVGTTIYPSAKVACKVLGVSEAYVRNLVLRKRAKYVD